MPGGRIETSLKFSITTLMIFQVFAGFSQTDSFPPVARDDSKTTYKNVSVTLNVTSNDSDPDSLGGIDPATVDLDVARNGIQDKMDTPQGKFTVNSSGVVTFDPKTDFVGTASNSYTVRDKAGKTSNSAFITILVENPPNASPTASNDAVSTNENTAVTINVTANDTDSDGTIDKATVDLNTSTAGIQNSNSTTQGNFVVNATGIVTFTPATDFVGTASVTYTVNDNNGATSNIATITVTVTITPNVAPVAVNDAATTTQNSPVTINVVANDTDIDGTINPATVDLNTTQSGIQNSNTTLQGSFSVNASGVVTYTPTTDYTGTASLNYRVNDDDGAVSNSATITITVSATPNVKPVAVNDAATTLQNNPVTINVLANDSDSDGTINTATVDLNTVLGGIQNSNTTLQGNFSVNASGVVTYTPATGFSGTASVKYTVNDDDGATSNEATISITVNAPENKAPTAVNDAATTNFNKAVTVDVTANDIDSDGTINKATVDLNTGQAGIQTANSTTQGNYTVNSAGVVTFTPANNFSGSASVKYTVNDDDGATSNEATIAITVNTPENNAPVAVNDAATTTINTAVTINVTANDTDSDGTVNKATVDLNTTQTGIQTTNNTTQGNYSVNNTGVVTYTPASNYTGSASVKYTVNDNDGATSNEATITITVNAADNKVPTAVNDAATTNANTAVTIDVTVNDTDSDGTINKATVDLNTGQTGIQTSNNTTQGSYEVNNTGVVTFTPANNFSGTATVKYTVNDNSGSTSNEATITVTVNALENKAPVAANDAATTNANTSVTVDVTANDTDSDGTINKATVDLNTSQSGIQVTNITAQGNYSVNNIGIVTYTPANNFSGTASITYTVNDNDGVKSNNATINIRVNAVNKAPTAVADNVATEKNKNMLIDILSNDTDSDGTLDATSVDLNPVTTGDQKKVEIVQGTFEVNTAGVVTYTPANNFLGVAAISYTVKDNEGAVSNTVNLTVEVSEEVVPGIDIPTGFTPNGDGANETWKIVSKNGSLAEMPSADIKVFDKRGVLVYDARGFDKSWDGKHNGELLPADSYYYIIDLKRGKTYKGIVTILTNR